MMDEGYRQQTGVHHDFAGENVLCRTPYHCTEVRTVLMGIKIIIIIMHYYAHHSRVVPLVRRGRVQPEEDP